jgi:hypothetical protein
MTDLEGSNLQLTSGEQPVEWQLTLELIGQDSTAEVELEFSGSVDLAVDNVPNFVDQVRSIGNSNFRLTLAPSDSQRAGMAPFVHNNDVVQIPLLTPDIIQIVVQAHRGYSNEAIAGIRRKFGGVQAWRFRDTLKQAVDFSLYTSTLDTLAGAHDRFSHVQYRSRHGTLAKLVRYDPPWGITSIDQLQNRIEIWNNALNLESVSYETVLSDFLGRRWYRDDGGDERTRLREIGVDPYTIDTQWKTPFPAAWIAHLVVYKNDGIDAALRYAHRRPSQATSDYQTLRDRAHSASSEKAISAYGDLVAAAKPNHKRSFRRDAYSYLQTVAGITRDKTKRGPMVYEAARQLVPKIGDNQDIRQEMEARREIATGHAWRRDQAQELERRAFSRAVEVAKGGRSEYTPDPTSFVLAVSSLAHAMARNADTGKAIELYREAEELINQCAAEYDIQEHHLQHSLGFVRDQLQKIS